MIYRYPDPMTSTLLYSSFTQGEIKRLGAKREVKFGTIAFDGKAGGDIRLLVLENVMRFLSNIIRNRDDYNNEQHRTYYQRKHYDNDVSRYELAVNT